MIYPFSLYHTEKQCSRKKLIKLTKTLDKVKELNYDVNVLNKYERKKHIRNYMERKGTVVNMSKERAMKNLEVARKHFNLLQRDFVKVVRKRFCDAEEINEVLVKMDHAKCIIAKYERLAL